MKLSSSLGERHSFPFRITFIRREAKSMIGEKLRQLRSEKGITQLELAKAVDVSVKTVKNWESDINDPDLSHAIAIADYYDITIDELVGRDIGDHLLLNNLDESDRNRMRKIYRTFSSESTIGTE